MWKHAGWLRNASLWQTARCQVDTSKWCKHTAVSQANIKEMQHVQQQPSVSSWDTFRSLFLRQRMGKFSRHLPSMLMDLYVHPSLVSAEEQSLQWSQSTVLGDCQAVLGMANPSISVLFAFLWRAWIWSEIRSLDNLLYTHYLVTQFLLWSFTQTLCSPIAHSHEDHLPFLKL